MVIDDFVQRGLDRETPVEEVLVEGLFRLLCENPGDSGWVWVGRISLSYCGGGELSAILTRVELWASRPAEHLEDVG
jgi:hypothetical protein